MARIDFSDLLVPAFLKSMFYFGLMVSTLYFDELIIFILIGISIVVLEILSRRNRGSYQL